MLKQSVTITDELMQNLATYMNDEIREQVHGELAPCTNNEFLVRYCELDYDFPDVLQNEFDLGIDEKIVCKTGA